MAQYRRFRVDGGTVFLTVGVAARGSDVSVRHVDVLREAVRVTQAERPFEVAAWVVLPDHFHCVWQLPEGDADFSTRIGAIKARFTMGARRAGFSPPVELPRVRSGQFVGLKPDLRCLFGRTKKMFATIYGGRKGLC